MAEKKPYSSIIDALLDEREPDWKDLDLAEAKDSGEEQLNRTHQYVDKDFMDEIAESASHHTPIIGPRTSSVLRERLYEKEKAAPHVSSVPSDWRRTATTRPEDYKNSYGDNESLMDEVTMNLEKADPNFKENSVSTGITDGQALKYVRDLLNQGTSPAKVAQIIEKMAADLEVFNHQMSTDYLQRNAGLMGLAYLEPNTYMPKDAPRGKNSSVSSNDCVRQHNQWKQAGITPQAKSVKQISACTDCSYFKKDASGKSCNLYHLPVVANTAELSHIVNLLTPGVPNKNKRAALVQIANRTDMQVLPPKTSSAIARTEGYDIKQAERVKRATSKVVFDSSHVMKLHAAGASLDRIYKWASEKFNDVDVSKAIKNFVASLRKDDAGRIVVAKSDLEFLAKKGIRNAAFQSSAKCASCESHFGKVREVTTKPFERPMSILPQEKQAASQERTIETVRKEQPKKAVYKFAAADVERLHNKGYGMKAIYEAAANKVGAEQAGAACRKFVASLKDKPIKVALSQIDCTYLKNKLGVHNPIIGAEKCGSCTYRSGMHCGLTGGTLLSYPGMDKASSNHKTAAGAPEDGRAILGEYDLMGPAVQQDIPMDGPERAEVEMDGTYKLDVE